MSRWQAHRATFECPMDGFTARALRADAFEGRAPVCPKCRVPMRIQDIRGITEAAKTKLWLARGQQWERSLEPRAEGMEALQGRNETQNSPPQPPKED